MGIFRRLFKIGEAKANKMVNELEKPELMLEQAIRDKEEQISDVKKSVMAVIASEKETKGMLDQEKAEQKNWEQKAEAALQSGKEDLAVKALTRAHEHEQKISILEDSWKNQHENAEVLKKEIEKMENDLAEFKRNKDFLIAQSKTADVKKQIYEARAKIKNDKSADDLMARMKAKAERTTYEAEAAEEMAEAVTGDKLKKEFAEIDEAKVKEAVDKKLAALKLKMAK
ncbi:MAG TPA: PspA/IM30 family protein [Caldithrix sp.]|nr:PspA/IM30 family protein [Caldithrix sp.]